MNRIKFHVKKGDNVEVIAGNYKGSSGKIVALLGTGLAAALVAVGYFTPYLDPYLRLAGIVKTKPNVTRPLPPVNPCRNTSWSG